MPLIPWTGVFPRPMTSRGRQTRRKRRVHKRRAAFESLEPRVMLTAATLHVSTFEDIVDPNDGVLSLREAIIQANSDSRDYEIILSRGTYRLTQAGSNEDNAASGDLDVLNNGRITIAGTRSTETFIEADSLGDRIFDVRPGGALTLRDLTLTGGSTPLSSGEGGAIRSTGGSLFVIDSIIAGNTSRQQGGAIYSSGGAVEVINSQIADNWAAGLGGAVTVMGGTLLIHSSRISGNVSDTRGGAVAGMAGVVEITDSHFDHNAANRGGAIAWEGGAMDLIRSTFNENSARVLGGALYADAGSGSELRVVSSTLMANTADIDGGAIYARSGALSVIASTISDNSAAERGGAIFADQAVISTVSHSTITNNRAVLQGGGVRVRTPLLTLHHTIVAGNHLIKSHGQTSDDISGTRPISPLSSHNLVGDGGSAGDLQDANRGNIVGNGGVGTIPIADILEPLADNGGPTWTHTLAFGSPAINTGAADFVPAAFDSPHPVDQRGFDRVVGGRIDIGAVEYEYIESDPGGLIEFDQPTLTRLTGAGDVHEWTFWGTVGQYIALVAEPGLNQASLKMINMQLLAPDGTIVAARSSQAPGEIIEVVDIVLGAEGTYRLRTQATDAAPHATGIYRLAVWHVQSLPLAAPVSVTVELRQAKYFRVEAPAGAPLVLELNDLPPGAKVDLYARMAARPSLHDFDASSRQDDAQRLYFAPQAHSQTYYIMLYAPGLTSAQATVRLTASSPALEVHSTDFGTGGNIGDYTLRAIGTNFDPTMMVQLRDDSELLLSAKSLHIHSGVEAYATFDLRGLAPGRYHVVFRKSEEVQITVPSSLEVVTVELDAMLPRLVAPMQIRRRREFSFSVVWVNHSLNDLPAPLLTVGGPVPFGLQRGDYTLGSQHTFLGTSSGESPPGIIRPGQREILTFWAFSPVDGDDYYTVYTNRVNGDEHTLMDWDALRPQMQFLGMADSDFEPIFQRVLAQVGPTQGDYAAMLARNANLLPAELGNVRNPADLLQIELLKARAAVASSITGIASSSVLMHLGGHRVTAHNTTTEERFYATTLNDGSFYLHDVTPGVYTFGFNGAALTDSEPVSVTAVPGEMSEPVSLAVSPTGDIQVKVRDWQLAEPLHTATVMAVEAGGATYFARRFAEGYQLKGVPTGTYIIVVDAPGRARTRLENVEVTGGQQLQLTVALQQESILRGTVRWPESIDPEAVTTEVFAERRDDDQPGSAFWGTLNHDRFMIDSLPQGTYDIFILGDRYPTVPLTEVSVAGSVDLDIGELSPVAAATIGGHVLLGTADIAHADIHVEVYGEDELLGVSPIDEFGNFELSNLPPGTYQLRAMTFNRTESSQRVITVSEGETRSDIVLELLVGGVVGGQVRSTANNTPVAGMEVRLIHDGVVFDQTQTDEQGRYRFAGLPRGDFLITLPVSLPGTAANVAIDAVNGEETTINLTLPFVAQIQGVLRTAGGQPVANGMVRLLRSGQLIDTAISQDDGRYGFLLLEPGTFNLQAHGAGAAFAVTDSLSVQIGQTAEQDFTAGQQILRVQLAGTRLAGAVVNLYLRRDDAELLIGWIAVEDDGVAVFDQLVEGDYRIDVSAGENRGAQSTFALHSQSPLTLSLTLQKRGELSGQVTDSHNRGLPNAVVILVSAVESNHVRLAVADADGFYRITNLPAGRYHLTTFTEGYGAYAESELDVSEQVVRNITIDPSTMVIRGKVVTANGAAVPAASIVVTDAAGQVLGLAQTDENGGYQISTALGEHLIIAAYSAGYSNAELNAIAISAGQHVTLDDIVLQPVAIATAPMFELISALSPADAIGYRLDVLTPVEHPVAGFFEYAAEGEPDLIGRFVPKWLRNLTENFRVASELRLADIPPLPADCPQCQGQHQKVLDAVNMQAEAYKSAQQAQQALRSADKRVGRVTDNLIFTIGKESLTLAFAKFRVGSIVAQTLMQFDANCAAIVVSAVESIYDDIMTLAKMAVSHSTADSLPAFYDGLAGLIASLSASVDLSTALICFDKSANLGGLHKVRAIFNRIKDVLNFIPKIVDASERVAAATKNLIERTSTYEQAKEVYEGSVKDAQMLLDVYLRCLQEHDEDLNPKKVPEYPDDRRIILRPASWDPNDIVGPAGVGPLNHIVADAVMPYMIRFENDPLKASAPAAVVTITQRLDAHLDWNTFRLGEIGLGETIVSVPAGTTAFQTRVDLVSLHGVYVDIEAGIDVVTGEIYWQFYSIDPETGELPDDPMLGFLPPNTTAPEGDGFVTYTIFPRSTVVTGDRVDAEATIVFDENPPIITAPIFNTFDVAAPSSRVTPLPSLSDLARFIVQWDGLDDGGGSGVAAYDIYVSVDGGIFQRWLRGANATSAEYEGEFGKAYAFFSVAIDHVGHREPMRTVADTGTMVLYSGPSGTEDSYDVPLGTRLAIASPMQGVLGNDFLPPTDPFPESDKRLRVDLDRIDLPGLGSLQLFADGTFVYTSHSGAFGDVDVFYYHGIDSMGQVGNRTAVKIHLQRSPLQNPDESLAGDVNHNGMIEPLDALLVLNLLARHRAAEVRAWEVTDAEPYYYDVNGDGSVQPIDALLVLNAIARQRRAAMSDAEGEIASSARIAMGLFPWHQWGARRPRYETAGEQSQNPRPEGLADSATAPVFTADEEISRSFSRRLTKPLELRGDRVRGPASNHCEVVTDAVLQAWPDTDRVDECQKSLMLWGA